MRYERRIGVDSRRPSRTPRCPLLLFDSFRSLPEPTWLDDGTALFDRFGSYFTLLRLGGDRVAETIELERAASARGLPLKVVDIEQEEPRDIYGCDLVLIRPDGHVAWRGDVIGDAPAGLLDTVAGGPAIRESQAKRKYNSVIDGDRA